jgi:uncharacterized protein YndB with AHSA1/START domain
MTGPVPPTGRRQDRDGVAHLVLTRTFRAPVEDVWAAVTEPDRLERWIGTWSGDPASGEVLFRMTAEAADAPAERCAIEACEPPHHLVAVTSVDDAAWRLELTLDEADGVTTLIFAQALADPEAAAQIGPGWDYYLDRLVAAETGGDVAAIDFDAYYPSQAEHYRAAFS